MFNQKLNPKLQQVSNYRPEYSPDYISSNDFLDPLEILEERIKTLNMIKKKYKLHAKKLNAYRIPLIAYLHFYS